METTDAQNGLPLQPVNIASPRAPSHHQPKSNDGTLREESATPETTKYGENDRPVEEFIDDDGKLEAETGAKLPPKPEKSAPVEIQTANEPSPL